MLSAAEIAAASDPATPACNTNESWPQNMFQQMFPSGAQNSAGAKSERQGAATSALAALAPTSPPPRGRRRQASFESVGDSAHSKQGKERGLHTRLNAYDLTASRKRRTVLVNEVESAKRLLETVGEVLSQESRALFEGFNQG